MTDAHEPGRARRDDPDTSHEAAENIDATSLEHSVLVVLRLHGPPRGRPLCVAEIWRHYLPELSVDTISPRMCMLVRKGLARQLPKEPRENRYGNTRNQYVYEATERGHGRSIVTVVRSPPWASFSDED